jgi:tRNA threonylcarbamoyladenosine biosynthesis protein TsaE
VSSFPGDGAATLEREPVWRARSLAPETTEAVGESLGQALVPGALVALVGELGSGKTTLVRGLARGLGVEEPIQSPTFTRMRSLPGRLALHHFDAWRGGAEALFEEGGELLTSAGVAVVEWADRVDALLPRPRIELELRHRGPSERELRASLLHPAPRSGPAAQGLLEGLRAALERARATRALEILDRPCPGSVPDPGDVPARGEETSAVFPA